MKRLALLGASGHGKVVADAALASGWETATFFDDGSQGRNANGPWLIAGDTNTLLSKLSEFDGVIVSIGNCAVRWRKHVELRSAGAKLVTIIHPDAVVSTYATIGIGSVVMAGAVINIDATIGEACIINTGATVDHDCQLANSVHVCPGSNLSGDVRIGDMSWIGVGAAVKQCIAVGASVIVGAGAVVVNAVPDGQTVAGNPARILSGIA